MPGARAYDLMYRMGAPWDSVGVRAELATALHGGRVSATTHPRTIDLGCGTGANVVHLAELGFEAHGVDFSRVAIRRAQARAAAVRVHCAFVRGDLTSEAIEGIEGPFDLLTDFGTLDDLGRKTRPQMVETINRLARPGSLLIEWCFYSASARLPWFSFSGPSRMIGAISPGEIEVLFGDRWEIEVLTEDPARAIACFMLTHH